MRRLRLTHIGAFVAAGLILLGISLPRVHAAAPEPTLESYFADQYPADVIASYPPRLRAILQERMRAERRRAAASARPFGSVIREGSRKLRPYLEAARDAAEGVRTHGDR